ncbi:MAG: hypothetical protein DCC75_04210 [Proteobacteria bacterium]|nr:MAG: hypothetical protein DCC75_04210 [Pseudomonadota bacterium]
MKAYSQFLFVILSSFLIFSCAKSSGKNAPQQSEPVAKVQPPAMPQMTEQEMMEKFKEASTPGTEHAALKPLVGKWKTEAKWWKEPGKTPEVTKGSANHQWMLGKRFIKEEYKGKMMGQDFEGVGMLGYDNVKGRYVSTWTDSMSTGILTSEGSYDTGAKSLDMTAKFSCPMTGAEMTGRMLTRVIDENTHVFEMYNPGPDGKEFKSLEITYKRIG